MLAQYVSWWPSWRWRPATDDWGRCHRPSNGRIWSWQLQPTVDTSVRPAARHNCFRCCWWCKTTWVCPSPNSSQRSIAGWLALHSIRTFYRVFDFCKFALLKSTHQLCWPFSLPLSLTVAASFANYQPTGQASSRVHITSFVRRALLLLLCGCGAVYHLMYDRTYSYGQFKWQLKTFLSGINWPQWLLLCI